MISLSEVHRQTGESRQLIGFLIHDRRIPYRQVGRAKAIDQDGHRRLLEAIADFRRRDEPAAEVHGSIAWN